MPRLPWILAFVGLAAASLAQYTIPSLSRPYAALPVTTDLDVMSARLGGPGGQYAAAQLALAGRPGLTRLTQAMHSPLPTARLDAATGLVGMGTPEALRVLTHALSDPDPVVIAEINHGLRLYRNASREALLAAATTDPHPGCDVAVDMLQFMIKDGRGLNEALARNPKATGRARAIEVFWGNQKAMAEIAWSALRDPDPRIQVAGAQLFPRLHNNHGELTPLLNAILRHGSIPARLTILGIYGSSTFPSDPNILRAASGNQPAIVRASFATVAIRNFFWVPVPTMRAVYLAMIAAAMNDPVAANRALAARQIAEFVDQTGSRPSGVRADSLVGPTIVAKLFHGLRSLLVGPNKNQAATQLAFFGDGSGFPVLARMLQSGKPEEQWPAILAMGNLRDRRAVPQLASKLKDGNLIEMACFALGKIGDPSALPSLEEVADRERGNSIGQAALKAIGQIQAHPSSSHQR